MNKQKVNWAREYRPKVLQDVVGQAATLFYLKKTLENSSERPSSFIFYGHYGCGKTTVARIVAAGLNCLSGPTPSPCGDCSSCVEIFSDQSLDCQELDAASRTGVDDMRSLIGTVALAPLSSRVKVIILDEAHMLSKSAFNAFLKTMEEPPRNVLFILATTELEKIPATVRSRAISLPFAAVDEEDIVSRLEYIAVDQGYKLPREDLLSVALSSNGSVRSAIMLLERALYEAGGNDIGGLPWLLHANARSHLTHAVRIALNGDGKGALAVFEDLYKGGMGAELILDGILDELHKLSIKSLSDKAYSPRMLQQCWQDMIDVKSSISVVRAKSQLLSLATMSLVNSAGQA